MHRLNKEDGAYPFMNNGMVLLKMLVLQTAYTYYGLHSLLEIPFPSELKGKMGNGTKQLSQPL